MMNETLLIISHAMNGIVQLVAVAIIGLIVFGFIRHHGVKRITGCLDVKQMIKEHDARLRATSTAIMETKYTVELLAMIDRLIQRSVSCQLYKQFGRLPLENFTASMMTDIIGTVANDINDAIDVIELSKHSSLRAAYLYTYIADTTITVVDSTIHDMITAQDSM